MRMRRENGQKVRWPSSAGPLDPLPGGFQTVRIDTNRRGNTMFRSLAARLRWLLLGSAVAALVLTTTTALAGSGVGGVFNLGQVNSVDAQTTLSGNAGGNPQLKVVNSGTS